MAPDPDTTDVYAGHAGSRTLDEQGEVIHQEPPTAEPPRDPEGRLIPPQPDTTPEKD